MDTALIEGRAIPAFDKTLVPWLHRARQNPVDDPAVWTVGIRNDKRQIYRRVTVHGSRQYLDLLSFFVQVGFGALPLEYSQEPGIDYVFGHESW